MNFIDPEIENYCREHTSPLPEVFEKLKEATYSELKLPNMQVGLLEGSFLQILVAITGAKKVIEFGTFSGFSALAMANALPEDGKLITCDIDPNATALAKKFWDQSPHGKKIELRLGPGIETAKSLEGPFDLVFIDANKDGYISYWDICVPKLKKGGLIVVDNVLWSGKVLKPQDTSGHYIAAFNKHAREDSRMQGVMLTIRDGIYLARKL